MGADILVWDLNVIGLPEISDALIGKVKIYSIYQEIWTRFLLCCALLWFLH